MSDVTADEHFEVPQDGETPPYRVIFFRNDVLRFWYNCTDEAHVTEVVQKYIPTFRKEWLPGWLHYPGHKRTLILDNRTTGDKLRMRIMLMD
jgi:hypothetical protein